MPCEDCITLAMCRNKKKIICELLHDFIQQNHDLTWGELHKILPKPITIYPESGKAEF
jgi:hypothetical protein